MAQLHQNLFLFFFVMIRGYITYETEYFTIRQHCDSRPFHWDIFPPLKFLQFGSLSTKNKETDVKKYIYIFVPKSLVTKNSKL